MITYSRLFCLKVHLFWPNKSLFSYVYINSEICREISPDFPVCVRTCTACDFRNACCYEHAETMLYGVIWPVDTVSGPQRPVGVFNSYVLTGET